MKMKTLILISLILAGCVPVLPRVCDGNVCGVSGPVSYDGETTMLITAAHVVNKSDGLVVVKMPPYHYLGRHSVSGHVVALDRWDDVAMVIVPGRVGRPYQPCKSPPEVGDEVMIYTGRSVGFTRSRHERRRGIVTAVDGTKVMTNIHLYPGDSGSPLYRGRCLVGIGLRFDGSNSVFRRIR